MKAEIVKSDIPRHRILKITPENEYEALALVALADHEQFGPVYSLSGGISLTYDICEYSEWVKTQVGQPKEAN